MPAREAPQPPYVLLYEEAAPGMEPLLISVDDRPSLPLFDSATKAQAFLDSTDFGPDWKPVEVSGAGLLVVLESCRGKAYSPDAAPSPRGSAPPVKRSGSPSPPYSMVRPWALPKPNSST